MFDLREETVFLFVASLP